MEHNKFIYKGYKIVLGNGLKCDVLDPKGNKVNHNPVRSIPDAVILINHTIKEREEDEKE